MEEIPELDPKKQLFIDDLRKLFEKHSDNFCDEELNTAIVIRGFMNLLHEGGNHYEQFYYIQSLLMTVFKSYGELLEINEVHNKNAL